MALCHWGRNVKLKNAKYGMETQTIWSNQSVRPLDRSLKNHHCPLNQWGLLHGCRATASMGTWVFQSIVGCELEDLKNIIHDEDAVQFNFG